MTELEKQTFDKANALIEKYKQIEEMSMLMTEGACPAMDDAERLYNAGYRKASEVAREIFEEIESIIRKHDERPKYQLMLDLAELKKKYT